MITELYAPGNRHPPSSMKYRPDRTGMDGADAPTTRTLKIIPSKIRKTRPGGSASQA